METRLIDVAKNDPRYYEMFVSYRPEKRKIILPKELTGWKEDQEFKTEDLDWHPLIMGGELYIIAHEATEQGIILCGKPGYDNVEEIVKKITDLHASEELGTTGKLLTKEVYEALPGFLQKTAKRRYILASRCVYYDRDYAAFRVFLVSSFGLNADLLCLSFGSTYGLACAVRPVIHLPSNILVEMNDDAQNGLTPETGWKLKLPEAERKENVEKQILKSTFETPRDVKHKEHLARLINEFEKTLKALRQEYNRLD